MSQKLYEFKSESHRLRKESNRRAYYNNRERALEYGRRYRREHSEYFRAYAKVYGQKHKERLRKTAVANHKLHIDVCRNWLWEYKQTLKCVRCCFANAAALHFHHRDPSTKKFAIGNFPAKVCSIADLQKEIEKCDPLCANCHFEEHTNVKGYRSPLRRWLEQYKSVHSCVDCGDCHPAHLQFDHRQPSEKKFDVGTFSRCHRERQQELEDEVSKCDVRCANCHHIKHFSETSVRKAAA